MMKRLMVDILHHLVWKKTGKSWDKLPTSTVDRRTSSISFSAIMKQFGMFHLSHLRRKKRGSHPIPRSTTPAGPGFQRLPRKPGLQNWDPQAWIENDLHLRKPEMALVEQKEPLKTLEDERRVHLQPSSIWKGKWSEPNLHHYGPC